MVIQISIRTSLTASGTHNYAKNSYSLSSLPMFPLICVGLSYTIISKQAFSMVFLPSRLCKCQEMAREYK